MKNFESPDSNSIFWVKINLIIAASLSFISLKSQEPLGIIGHDFVSSVAGNPNYKATVTNGGEVFILETSSFEGGVALHVCKYNAELTAVKWRKKIIDTAYRYISFDCFSLVSGEVYIIDVLQFDEKGEHILTRIKQVNPETGDMKVLFEISGYTTTYAFREDKKLFLATIKGEKSTLAFSVYGITKLDLSSLSIEWEKKLDVNMTGFCSMAVNEEGVLLYALFNTPPYVNGKQIICNTRKLIAFQFSENGEVSFSENEQACCYLGLGKMVELDKDEYAAFSAYPAGLVIGSDTLENTSITSALALIKLDLVDKKITKAKLVTEKSGFYFNGLVDTRLGIFGFYSNYWVPQYSRLVVLDRYSFEEIWSLYISGRMRYIFPGVNNQLYAIGEYFNEIKFGNRVLTCDNQGCFIVKFDMDRLKLPSIPWKDTLTVFPVPAEDELNFHFDKDVDTLIKITIFKSLGQEFASFYLSRKRSKIDTSLWEEGTYFVRVQEEGKKQYYKKIVICRRQ